jgi:hypothetical protein
LYKGKYTKKADKFFENVRVINNIKERKCTQCGIWQEETIEFFYMRNKNKPEKGFQSECKVCSRERSLARRQRNPEICNTRERKRYKRKRKEIIERVINYNQKNYDKIRKDQEKYRKSERGKQKYKEYEHRIHEMYDQEWELCKKYFNYRCACCGLPIENHYVLRNGKMIWFDFQKDHVCHEGKNDLRNCIPLCSDCNNKKKRKTFNEFYNPSNPNYIYERYHNIYLWIRYNHKKYIMPKRRYKNQHLIDRLKEIEINKINKLIK